MTAFKDLDSIFAHVKKSVAGGLKNEVFDFTKALQSEEIRREVYDVYNPVMYDRRGADGGLGDPENIVGAVDESTLTLIVTNETPPNPYAPDGASTNKSLAEVVEYGEGYDYYKTGAEYLNPRPFTQATYDELKSNKTHVEMLKIALNKRGIKTL